MKVLVSAATKYRAASEIGQAVADVLAERGCEVRGAPAGEGGRGRGVQRGGAEQRGVLGQWMKPARELSSQLAWTGGGGCLA
jgi:hypothetical protein